MAVSDIPVHVFVMCISSPQAMQLKILLLLVIGFLQVLQDFSDALETLAFLGLSSESILLKILLRTDAPRYKTPGDDQRRLIEFFLFHWTDTPRYKISDISQD